MAESTYAAATSSMREVTKWMVTIIPGAGSVLVITQIVPGWSTRSLGLGQLIALAVVAVVAGIAVVVAVCSAVAVLRPHVSGWGELQVIAAAEVLQGRTGEPTSLVRQIDASGTLLLHDFASLSAVSSALLDDAPDDDLRSAAEDAVEFADHVGVQRAFQQFLVRAGIAGAVIVVCFGVSMWTLTSVPASIEGQVAVAIVAADGAGDYFHGIGCEPRRPLKGFAVGGAWSSPVVILSTSGCNGVQIRLEQDQGRAVPVGQN